MSRKIRVVDAFTERPFAGNPAAVCVLEGPADEQWMKNLAREMNLSETAFLHPLGGHDGDGAYALRWLTPVVEVDLCGHATLASAHVLWEEGFARRDTPLRFSTRSGTLLANRRGSEIELDFPSLKVEPTPKPMGLDLALGADTKFVGSSRMDLFVELANEATVRQLTPDFTSLATIPARGIIVTSRANPGSEFDFVSRFFAPASGIAEDPVTGSAHCALAVYWGDNLGKSEMRAYQASERGGIVSIRREGDRVILGGHAVTVWRGELVDEASN